MFDKKGKGFALNGWLVFILIVATAGFVLWYVLGNFVEGSRVKDAERIIGIAVDAQDRYMMSRGHYTQSWTALNAVPLAPYMKQKGKYVNGSGTVFFNKGGGPNTPNNGFKMYFNEIGSQLFIVAERVNGRYSYTLVRPMSEATIFCIPSKNVLDEKFCAEYMNVDSAAKLPADPRYSTDSYY